MSESSLSLTTVPAGAGPYGAELIRSLTPLLTEWLPRQRWFAGKGRPISGFSLVTATELLPCSAGGPAPGLLHLLVRARQPGTDAGPAEGPAPEAEGGVDAAADCYQLLLGVREALPPELAPALIGSPTDGPLRDRVLYEALLDPHLSGHLLERLRGAEPLGTLRFLREPDVDIPSGLPPRPLAAEQSNSSVIYGSACILKLFRRVERGVNPDLELPLALARHGSDRVPAPLAWFEAVVGGDGTPERAPRPADAPDTMTLGVLQPFLTGSRDGWQLALNALGDRRYFTEDARALGHATAEVHTGLAGALPTTVLGRRELELTAADMTERLETVAAAVPELRPYRSGLRDAFEALAGLSRDGHSCAAQRVHGDLHLGQLLRDTRGHWSLIDFEGEPARPLAERRGPQPVVRDIAGILRSFDYAACQQDADPADPWTQEWAEANRAAFCAGYAESSGSDPRDEPTLLRAYETDKAVYEVLYEARHRPGWLHVPLSAIRRLAAPPSR